MSILRLILFTCGVLLASVLLAQDSGPGNRLGGGSNRVAAIVRRLESLSPSSPREYFLLGEEIASEAPDDVDRRLARQLYVLAYEIDKRSQVPDPRLGGSVCLALAAIAESDDEKRWLTALAETLAPEGTPDMRRIKSTTASRDPSAFDLATMLSFVRVGEGRRAEKILEKPGVNELLEKCDKLLLPGVGGAAQVRRRIDEWPNCPQCRGHRSVKDATGVHLCPTCKGTPGPTLSPGELVGHIRTESILLSGQQRSWAGQLIADAGATLRELNPSELPATFGVNASRPLWRGGAWVSDPNAPSPPPNEKKDPSAPPAADATTGQPIAPGKRAG